MQGSQPYEAGAMSISLFKKWHRETEQFAQGHTAKKQQSKYLTQGWWVAKPVLFIHMGCLPGRKDSLKLHTLPHGPSLGSVELLLVFYSLCCAYSILQY